MDSLPLDILCAILEHMDQDKHGLATLCRVNRAFREVTESVLYRRIIMPLPAVSRVCITLASDRLALHVRHFETSKKPGWKPRDARELIHMRNALRKMRRLHTLRIHFGGPLAFMLDGCSFVELRSLVCNLSCDYHLAGFFKRQIQLTDIIISSIHSDHFPCFIDQSCLPNLKRISADPIWLGKLVPNHSITNIDVWDFIESPTGPTGPTGSWDIDWLSGTPVTSLSVSESFLVSRGAARVASRVPNLRCLKIDCATPDIFAEEETEKRLEFTAWLSQSLGFFKSLVIFGVLIHGSFSLDETEDPRLRQFITDASECTCDLHEFVVTFSRSSNAPSTTVVWRRVREMWSQVDQVFKRQG